MDEFARRPTKDRHAFIEEAAARRDLTVTIVEKDFWVCWTLRRLTRFRGGDRALQERGRSVGHARWTALDAGSAAGPGHLLLSLI